VQELLAILVFLTIYALLISEKVDRSIVAILGATVLLFFGVFEDPLKAYTEYVDYNTIYLLIGMMLFVNTIKRSGIFQFFGLLTLKISGGNLVSLFFSLTFMVAFLSAILDNVTTILVTLPMTFAICDTIEVDPTVFVFGEIFASNIGGTMTLVGDPPNIMIGSAAGLTFMDFLKNTAPIALLNLLVVDIIILIISRKSFKLGRDIREALKIDLRKTIVNMRDFKISLSLLLMVIILFTFQHQLGTESSVIALFVGFLSVLLMSKKGVKEILKEVEWETILFFLGLFIVVGGLEEVGLLERMGRFLMNLAKGNYVMTEMLILNFSGLISAFVDNIPYTATMIPVIESLKKLDPVTFHNLNPLWWSLSLGACLGGNGTAVGASANVVGLAIFHDYYGSRRISFLNFLKFGMLVLAINLVLSSLYVLIRYR